MSVFSPASKFEDFVYRHFRIIHAAKLALALLIAAVINGIWSLPHFIWSMVTIVIIMMSLPQFGGALEKSLQRTIGTCLGSAYGVFLIMSFNNYWLIMGLLIIAVSIICYISAGRYSYAYLVAGFTIIIVIGDANQATSEAIWRTANILMGCLIAILVSLFILPIKAKQDWRCQLSKSLNAMGKALDQHFHKNNADNLDNREQIEIAMKAVITQKKLFFSLEWESTTLRHNKHLIAQLAQEQIRVVTLLELLMQTRWHEHESDSYKKLNQIANTLQQKLCDLADFVNGYRTSFPSLHEQMSYELHQELLASLDNREQQVFTLTGYAWLIYQLAKAIESIYAEIHIIDQAYLRKKYRKNDYKTELIE